MALEPFVIMGIVNATPDSFSDGGQFSDPSLGVARALHLVEEGASIVDIGGESTRPGAARVPPDEQIHRTSTIIRQTRVASDVVLSIDTTLASVAEAALDAGADAVNDVSAGGDDPRMFSVVAERGCGIVLMHRVLPPEDDRYGTAYAAPLIAGDVMRAVGDWLLARVDVALSAGIEASKIVLDPGLGFGKTVQQNFELLARVAELADLGFPVLIGASRKSFIGHATGRPHPHDRIAGSVVAACAAAAACPAIVRTHDVAMTRDGLRVLRSILAQQSEHYDATRLRQA